MKNIVLLGGGSGISHLIRAFIRIPDWSIRAIVAMSDSGGSTGIIRDSYNVPAIGDLIKNLAALGGNNASWLTYRHQKGFLAGHTTGNLWLLGLIEQYGVSNAIKKAHEMLGYTKHAIIPATKQPHHIEIKTSEEVIRGESAIIQSENLSRKVKDIYLVPQVPASNEAIEAIHHADIIIIGPGTLYTSIMASILPLGISDAIRESEAKKIFIANAANFPPGHCDGYSIETYLDELSHLVGLGNFTAILAHDGTGVSPGDRITIDVREDIFCMNCIDTPDTIPGGKFDSIKRNALRHDGEKVAQWIKKFFD